MLREEVKINLQNTAYRPHNVAYRTILDASKLLGRSFEPEYAISGILKLLAERLYLRKGRILIPDKANKLHIRYSFDLTEEEKHRGKYSLGEGITGNVMKTGKMAIVHNVSQEPLYLARVSNLMELTKQSIAYIAVPIIQDEIPVAVLAVHPDKKTIREHNIHIELLEILACIIGQVLKINNLMEIKKEEIKMEIQELNQAHTPKDSVYGIIGNSPPLIKAIKKVRRAAASNAAVILIGESGVGKERFARLIHIESDRRDQPFVCVNCAAIPENLLESELFGHEKGSFTGATTMRCGKFEFANDGTLFLDEIGDMNVELQAKLLRVLQEKVVQRVGSNEEIPVNTRIICATNKNLDDAVNEGRFRMDLYYRLNVVKINLPSLRERTEDILLFASYFLSRENQRYQKNIAPTPRAMNQLKLYDWPGNVRQLENFIERLVIMSEQDLIKLEDMKIYLEDEAGININLPTQKTQLPFDTYADQPQTEVRPYTRVKQEDHQAVTAALQRARGNKTQAARILGLSPRQLHYRLSKLDIN